MSFRPFEIEGSFSAEHACVVEHGRNSEESDTDEGDEGLGEHDGSFREVLLLIMDPVNSARKAYNPCLGYR